MITYVLGTSSGITGKYRVYLIGAGSSMKQYAKINIPQSEIAAGRFSDMVLKF